MRNGCLLLFATFSFLASSARSQLQELQTSSIETIAGAEATRVAGTEFSFGSVAGLATDAVGNTYFTLQALSRVYRLGVDGHVTVWAGSGVRGKHRDGALAVASPLLNPGSLAVDAAGNLFIASWQSLVRVDAGSGVLSTVFTPRDSSNSILDIVGMAVGPDGDLYVCDGQDWRIKKFSLSSGSVTVLAGNGRLGATQLGRPATSSPLKYPRAVAPGSDGTVYFSTSEPAIFRIRRDGKLEALNIRVNAKGPPLGDYDIPSHIALDGLGHLFVTQPNRSRILRIVLTSGYVSVYAGTGSPRFNGDGIKATLAAISPTDVVSDPSGNLTVAELYRIRRVEASTRLITTVAGNGLPVTDASTTSALHAKLWEPAYAVPAPDGTVYITSSFSNRLLRVRNDGSLTTLAGGGDFTIAGSDPGDASQVALYYPQGIWLDDNGDVYFSDYDNTIVRRLAQTGSISNFATTPKSGWSAGGFLDYAAALVADGDYFYLSDPNGNCVWRISRRDGAVERYAGTGTNAQSPTAGDAKSVQLAAPAGLALDSSRNLYIADGYVEGEKGRILRVNADDRQIVTILSDLRQPSGLAFQSPSVLCFAESDAHWVRCLDLADHSIRIVAGTGVAGFGGDGGPAECAQLNRPTGISFDQMGNLYIADTGNQRIRRVRLGQRPVQCRD
jgi:sugar lactone lactonase YvrE